MASVFLNRGRDRARPSSQRRSASALAIVDQERNREEQNGRGQRPLIALDRLPRQAGVDIRHLHFGQTLVDELLHGVRPVFEMQIKSVRSLRDFAQARFIEL